MRRVRLALALLAMLPIALRAQPPDTSNWVCRLCPFPTGTAASFAAGATAVSDGEAHFGDATGYDDAGAYLALGGQGRYASETLRLRWRAEDLGLDARHLALEAGRPGTRSYALDFRQWPRRRFDSTQSPFIALGNDRLVLPASWVPALTTDRMPGLGAALHDSDIASDRQRLAIGARFRGLEHFDVYAEFRRNEQDGSRLGSLASFTSASQLARPFAYRSDEIEAGVRLGGTRSRLQIGYYGSLFDNAGRELVVDNPFTGVAGADRGRLTRAPDSTLHQISARGRLATGWRDGVLSYSAAAGIIEQDEAFLPYTINPNLPTSALPRGSLDGRVATTALAVDYSVSPLPKARLRVTARKDERDNRTPVASWDRIVADSFVSDGFEANTPYSFERGNYAISGEFRLTAALRVAGAYEYREIFRDFQEVAKQDERTGWGRLIWQAADAIELSAKLGTAKRDVDRYDTGVARQLGQNPLLRKFNLAYRYREFGELRIASTLPMLPLSIGATFRVADDSYSDSILGLLASRDQRFAADFGWVLSDKASISLTAARDRIDSEQAGREGLGGIDWRARHADAFDQIGIALRVDPLGERFALDLEANRNRGRTDIDVEAPRAGAGAFPALTADLDALRLRLRYRHSERVGGGLELRYQRFVADDWGLEGAGPATVPNLLALGADPYDYDVVLLALTFDYRVGP